MSSFKKKWAKKKLSFLRKKIRPKNEKKLKTDPKKLRSLEALCQAFFFNDCAVWIATKIAGKQSFDILEASFEILEMSFENLEMSFEILEMSFEIL